MDLTMHQFTDHPSYLLFS